LYFIFPAPRAIRRVEVEASNHTIRGPTRAVEGPFQIALAAPAWIGFNATRSVVNSREAIDGLRFFFAGRRWGASSAAS
jgi:hypothetical protein